MCRSRWLHLVVFVSALAHGGCGAGSGTLTGAGGNMGMATGIGGFGLPGVVLPGSGGVGNASGVTCGQAPGTARLLAPDIVIALDASSTMNADVTNMACAGGCGPSSKWAAAVAAINSVTASTADRVDWGLELFGADGVAACGMYTGVHVEAGPTSSGEIKAALLRQSTGNGGVFSAGTRQTRGAVNGARSNLNASRAPGSKFIVLITDGMPMCAPDGSLIIDDTPATVDAISAAAAAGMPTYVIGIGTAGGLADASITAMGNAGRDEPSGGPGYSAWTANDISAILSWVADRTAGCTFEVPGGRDDGTLSRSSIAVRVGANDIPRDTGRLNGWDYVDTTLTSIRLYGSACTAATASGPESVTIRFLCILI